MDNMQNHFEKSDVQFFQLHDAETDFYIKLMVLLYAGDVFMCMYVYMYVWSTIVDNEVQLCTAIHQCHVT